MRREVTAFAVAMFAAVVLSACGSSGATAVSLPHENVRGPGSIVFVAAGASAGLGVDNTDLVAATSSGSARDLTPGPAAESDAAWSADGTHVVFVRQSTAGQKNGALTSRAAVYVWAPGHGSARQIASCSTYCPQNEFAWSPDDRQIAFVLDSGPTIEVMNADGSGVHVVCDPARCGESLDSPVWSPDGRKLLFSNGGMGAIGPIDLPSSIWVANADGSGVQRMTQLNCTTFADEQLRTCARDTAPVWSPNGRMIAFSRWYISPFPTTVGPTGPGGPTGTTKQSRPTHPITTSVDVMRADGSHLRSIYSCSGAYCNQTLPPAWAPDGKAIAYAPSSGRTSPSSFRITTLAGRTSAVRTCAGSHCLSPDALAWSPSGRQLAFFVDDPPANSAWVIDRDGAEMHRVAADVQWGCFAWVGQVTLRNSRPVRKASVGGHPHLAGTVAFDTDESPSQSPPFLHLLSLATGRMTGLRLPTSLVVQPSWSPDGQELAFGAIRGNENTNIYVAHRDGSHLRELTHLLRGATLPTWSPDGNDIAFASDAGIDLVNVAGRARIRQLVPQGADPSWAPSGKELVFDRQGRFKGASEALFTVRSDGTGLHRLTNLPGEQRSPAWSPDGREIAFDWWTPAGLSLYLIRPDGTHLRRATPSVVPDGRPAWSPDGRYLLLLPNTNGGSAIDLVDVKTGRVTKLRVIADYAADPSWSSR